MHQMSRNLKSLLGGTQIKSEEVHKFIGGIRDIAIKCLIIIWFKCVKNRNIILLGFVNVKYLCDQNRTIGLC